MLRALASFFVGVDNETAAEAALLLKQQGLPTTPTGAAGLAGLLALAREPDGFEHFGIGPNSNVLIILTEQALS